MKNVFSFFLRFGLSAILLGYLFGKLDKAKMLEVLRGADVRFLLAALAAFFAVNLFLLLRWYVLIRAIGLKVPVKSVVNCFFIGLFFNLFLPSSTGGDLVKTVGLFRETQEKAKVVATVILDRLGGFVVIVLIALAAFLWGYDLIRDPSLLISILVLGTVSLAIVVVLFNETLYEFCCRVFNRFPHVKAKFMQLHYAVVLLKQKYRDIALVLVISTVSQMTFALVNYLVARGLHQDVPPIYFIIFVPLICVVSSLPSIGGLGVRDAGTAYLFAKVGMSTATAVSLSLINFLLMIIVGLIGGVIYVAALSSGRVQPYQAGPGVSPQEP